jgi:hypothetical protein
MEKLKDYTDSFYRLQEALDALLEKLRNDEKERMTLGGDFGANAAGLGEDEAAQNLRQSIEILRGFSESWRSLDRPEQSHAVPQSFRGLFRPMEEGELNATLEWLHQGAFATTQPAAPVVPPPAAERGAATQQLAALPPRAKRGDDPGSEG